MSRQDNAVYGTDSVRKRRYWRLRTEAGKRSALTDGLFVPTAGGPLPAFHFSQPRPDPNASESRTAFAVGGTPLQAFGPMACCGPACRKGSAGFSPLPRETT